jgi:hypothetical protein
VLVRRSSLDRLLGCGRGVGELDGGAMRDVAIERGGQLRFIIGVDLGVIRLTLSTYAHVIEAGRDRAAGVMDRVLQTRA